MKDPTEEMLRLQDHDKVAADFYRLKSPTAPWGDYGDILVHGLTSSEIHNGILRTGPFVPPVTFPDSGFIVVTDTVRSQLESSGLTGFSFVPAIKRVIVPIDWHEWDLLSEEPPFYPEEGEPEAYICVEEHSPALAQSMPDLWRLVTAPGATESYVYNGIHYGANNQVFIRAGSWQGADFFCPDNTPYHKDRHYVSARARQWLLNHFPAWLAFEPAQTK
jgi:hypothetical protein